MWAVSLCALCCGHHQKVGLVARMHKPPRGAWRGMAAAKGKQGMILLLVPLCFHPANNGGCHSWKWKNGRWQSHLANEEEEEEEERYARYRNCKRYIGPRGALYIT